MTRNPTATWRAWAHDTARHIQLTHTALNAATAAITAPKRSGDRLRIRKTATPDPTAQTVEQHMHTLHTARTGLHDIANTLEEWGASDKAWPDDRSPHRFLTQWITDAIHRHARNIATDWTRRQGDFAYPDDDDHNIASWNIRHGQLKDLAWRNLRYVSHWIEPAPHTRPTDRERCTQPDCHSWIKAKRMCAAHYEANRRAKQRRTA